MFRPIAGAILGPYTLERKLGHGITSEVWQASDDYLRRRSAVKFPTLEHVSDDWRAVYVREARALALCSHPSVVAVYLFGIQDGMPFVAMECLVGETLSPGIAARRAGAPPIGAGRALRIVAQVCCGLAEIHHRGVCHFDIKPANVVLTSRRAVLVDLGLCRLPDGDGPRGPCVGTPRYMAPEVALATGNFGHPADVYSAGCVAYELLCGFPPFAGETASAVMEKHVREVPRRIGERRRDLPQAVADLVESMMRKDPGGRPTAAEAAEMADHIADEADDA